VSLSPKRLSLPPEHPSRPLQPTPRGSTAGEALAVHVGSRVVLLPRHALCAGLSDLRLATRECVGLQDDAAGVGRVLAELERVDVLRFQV